MRVSKRISRSGKRRANRTGKSSFKTLRPISCKITMTFIISFFENVRIDLLVSSLSAIKPVAPKAVIKGVFRRSHGCYGNLL